MDERIARINNYACPQCNEMTITVDVDPGYTPNSIACGTEACLISGSRKIKGIYPRHIPDQWAEPTHEWHKPSAEEINASTAGERDFLKSGGLRLRTRTDAVPIFHALEEDPE